MVDEPEDAGQQVPVAPTPEERFTPPLPKQLQAQLDQANQLREQMEAEGPEDELEPEPEAEGEGYEEEPELPFEEPEVEETWEQRARSTAGRLQQALDANAQLAKRLSDLERSMTTRQLQQEPAPAAPKPKPRYVKDEEINDYGEEFFDVVGRRAKEEFDPILDQLGERLKRLETGQQVVGKVVEQTQKRTVYDHLYEAVPNWKEVNHHPAFKHWLSFPDPYSGRQRQEMLTEAFSRHDASRVVNFFVGFLTEATGTPPTASSPAPSAPHAPENGNGSGRPSLEEYAAPGRARSAPQTLPPEKPVYTQAQIARFADDKRKGKFRGREAEAELIERDIFQAQHEGRIF